MATEHNALIQYKETNGDMHIVYPVTKTENINGYEDDITPLKNHVTNKSNPHEVTKAQIGLGNVDNTADSAKSVASATKATQDSAGQQINTTYIKGLSVSGKTITYTKGNGSTGTITTQDTTYEVATTSANGLMSSSDKTKLDGIATGANKYTLPVAGSAIGGVKSGTDITVDSSGNVSVNNDSHTHTKDTISSVNASALVGIIPQANLPSYVDDVLEYKGKANFPSKGETGKIYVDTDTNLTYRWGGSAYVEISPSLALGETSSTAYRGDRGKIAYEHSQIAHARADATAVSSSSTNGNIKINGTETTVYTHPSTHAASMIKGLADVATSGSYADLSGKPTIPTVNNATLTIQKNGTSVGSFTANSASNVTANIIVPTKVSELTNDSGFTANAGTITGITMNGASKGTSGVVDLGTVLTSHQDISGKQDKNNIVASWSTITSDTKYPSEKLVKNSLDGKANSKHTHNYAGASSAGGSATSAVKLDTSSAGSATQPVYFEGGVPKAMTYTLGKSVPSNAVFTDTTYSAGNGISLSGTTFSNSGVRSIATGSTNGTISVNTNGTSAEVAVKGLGSAAYTASTAYAASSHNHAASNITSGTLSVDRLPTITIAKGGTGATTAAEALSNLGLTATAAELNYCDGVTSNIQTQLDTLNSNKADTSALAVTNITITKAASDAYLSMDGHHVKKQLNQVFGYIFLETKSDITGGANLVRFPSGARPAASYYCGLFNYTDGTIVGAVINTNGYLVNSTALKNGKVYVVNFSFYVA